MQIEVKTSCEILGQALGPDMRKKPRVFEVPETFKKDDYFKALVKEGKIIILDGSKISSSEDEYEEIEEAQENFTSEELQEIEPALDDWVKPVKKKAVMKKVKKKGK